MSSITSNFWSILFAGILIVSWLGLFHKDDKPKVKLVKKKRWGFLPLRFFPEIIKYPKTRWIAITILFFLCSGISESINFWMSPSFSSFILLLGEVLIIIGGMGKIMNMLKGARAGGDFKIDPRWKSISGFGVRLSIAGLFITIPWEYLFKVISTNFV